MRRAVVNPHGRAVGKATGKVIGATIGATTVEKVEKVAARTRAKAENGGVMRIGTTLGTGKETEKGKVKAEIHGEVEERKTTTTIGNLQQRGSAVIVMSNGTVTTRKIAAIGILHRGREHLRQEITALHDELLLSDDLLLSEEFSLEIATEKAQDGFPMQVAVVAWPGD